MPFQLRGRYRLDYLRPIAKRQTDESYFVCLPGQPPSQESPRETVATLVELTNALHQTISYGAPAKEGAASIARPKLCVDNAGHVAITAGVLLVAEMLRDLGLAARSRFPDIWRVEKVRVARKVRYMRGTEVVFAWRRLGWIGPDEWHFLQ